MPSILIVISTIMSNMFASVFLYVFSSCISVQLCVCKFFMRQVFVELYLCMNARICNFRSFASNDSTDAKKNTYFIGANLQWIVTAYTLAIGGLLLLGGRIGDIYGSLNSLLYRFLCFSFLVLVLFFSLFLLFIAYSCPWVSLG